MSIGVRLVLVFASACLSAWLSFPAGAAPTKDPIERRVLIDGKAAEGWVAVESTLTPATVDGVNALLFRVPVDWHAGEPEYPVGWPRMQTEFSQPQGDWGSWDEVRLRLLARSSAGGFPYRPFGITIRSDDQRGWEEDVESLTAGQWQDISFDLHELPFRDRVRGAGLFISEDKYTDGTVLEFYIARLELLRYTAPMLIESRPITDLSFADAELLAVYVKLAGVAKGETVPVELRLTRGEEAIAAHRTPALAGETRLSLPLPPHLAPGDYTISAAVRGRTLSASVRLITSPWQETD